MPPPDPSPTNRPPLDHGTATGPATGPGPETRRDRLAAAMEAYLHFRDRTSGNNREQLLAQHEDLRDLLEPMLDDGDGPERDQAPPIPAPDPSGLQPGRQVGDYRIVREVGRGGMGIVFEAEQISLRRRVALKLLHPHLAWAASSIARFRDEAAAAAQLRHPAIVPIFEVGEWRGLHYFSMEFVDGQPLSELLHRERIQMRGNGTRATEAADLVARVADALQHAHEHGLIHRDVKPHNIMVGNDGSLRLLDFGLVKHLEPTSQSASVSASGSFLGTPHYCSPEQIARGGIVDARSDVFSLAIVLYELLTRRRPFDAETPRLILQRIEQGQFESLRRTAPATPRDLITICHKALEVAPAARYASAGEFAADLRRFLAFEPIQARPPGGLVRAMQWTRRHRLAVALGTTTVLLAVGAPTAYLVHQYKTGLAVERERAVLDQAEELGFRSIEQTLALLGEQLDRQPGLPEEYRAEVDKVVRLCERFLQLRAEEPRRRARVARALYGTSHIYSRIGQLAPGVEACERALEILRSTEPAADTDTEHAELLDRLLRRRLHLRQQQIPRQSDAEFATAIARWQEQATRADCRTEIAMDYADILLMRARVLAEQPREQSEAERLLRLAIAALPTARYGEEPRLEVSALRAKTVLGVLQLATGRARDALQLLEPTNTRLAELRQTPLLGVERALATAAIGEAQQQLGQTGAAETSLRAAIGAAETLYRDYPGSQSLRRTLLRSRVRLGALCMAKGELAPAETMLRAMKNDPALTTNSWLDRTLAADLDLQLASCILLRTKGKERDEARRLFLEGVNGLEQLRDEQPTQSSFRVDLGGALNNLAGIANEDGDHELAANFARRAIAEQQVVLNALPKHVRARRFLGMHQSQLAFALANLGDGTNAAAAALAAYEAAPLHNPTLRMAAEAACLSAQRVAKQPDLTATERLELSERYAQVAIAGLRRIAANEPREALRWLQAERFAPLKEREDFQQLQKETHQ
jgi:eukaryotic-like serine/threonine-protein kinase